MVFYGIVYALLEDDMRRLLAYSIVSQVGFMVTAIGIGTHLALNGAAAQAFAGTFYTALMLMSAGSVLYVTGRRRLSELGGLYRSMPVTALCGSIGALALSAFPFTSGFISKSMITQAVADQHLLGVWLALTAAAAGMVLHAGIRFPWLVFFHKPNAAPCADPPASMRGAMLALSALCIALGIWYQPLYRLLPHAVDYAPYTGAHVLTVLQLLLFSALAFFILLRYLKRTSTITLDIDWLWRRGLPALVLPPVHALAAAQAGCRRAALSAVDALLSQVRQHHGPRGWIAATWPTGSMALWVLVLLLGYLLLYYLL
jgi:multicomponent Na+:H+ antiporter subunit D